MPAPNATLAASSVPAAAAGLPAAAPMFSVPREPAWLATCTVPACTVAPSATVSVPVPLTPIVRDALVLQAEPGPVTVTVPCEPVS